ncbi:MAG: large repetitive protein [Candidatus Diapherotrites archaeon]|nr:large repetitive protein [Candidatus Diapherotrites archaeon]MDN5366737.1 large repetitive protein [Candidatus Diapherotrites archaeon]
MKAIFRAIVLAVFALVSLGSVYAFPLSCHPTEVDVADTHVTVEVNTILPTSTPTDINAIYELNVENDGTILSGSVTLLFVGSAEPYYIFSGEINISTFSPDREHNLFVGIPTENNVEWNYCTIFAYNAPQINITPEPVEGWTNVNEYNISCTDPSGCEMNVYVDGELSAQDVNFVSLDLPDGEHLVSIVAADPFGYTSERNISVAVDTTPPDVNDLTPSIFGERGSVCPVYRFDLEASDDGSGIDYTRSTIILDGNVCTDVCRFEEGSVYVNGLPYGQHTIEANVCDAVGNCSLRSPAVVTVIYSESCASVGGPYVSGDLGRNGWYTDSTRVSYTPLTDGIVVLLNGEPIEGTSLGRERIVEVPEEGNNILTFRYYMSEEAFAEYNYYIPVDGTPPEFNWSWRLLPGIAININAWDTASGPAEANVCIDGNCSAVGCSGGECEAVFPLALGEHNVSITVFDVAGNPTDRSGQISIDLNDLLGELNVPALVTEANTTILWAPGEMYDGPYVFSIDGNAWEVNGTSAEITVSAGSHTICVSVPKYPEVNRCAELNADLALPGVSVSAPASTRSRRVTVSWSATDDFALSSVVLSIDGSPQGVAASGSMTVTLSYGVHEICISATDVAGRTAQKCITVMVRRPGGGGGGAPPAPQLPLPPRFPRDDIDDVFAGILTSAGIHFENVETIGEESGRGSAPASLVERATKEFGQVFAPVNTVWTIRKYRVDGRIFVLVIRRDVRVPVVYEYFAEDVNVYSPQLRGVVHGSTLATFRPEDGEYVYVVDRDTAGTPIVPVPRAPAPVPRIPRTVEISAAAAGGATAEENVAPAGSALTGYSLVTPQTNRAYFAGLLLVIAALAILAARYFEGRW